MRRVFCFSFYILVFLWIILSLLRIGNNFSKVFTEEKQWLFMSDEQKREKIFGDLHVFLRFVEKNTDFSSRILFFAPNGKSYYLGRYYLYPRLLTQVKSLREAEQVLKNSNQNYILVYLVDDKSIEEYAFAKWAPLYYKSLIWYQGTMSRAVLYKL